MEGKKFLNDLTMNNRSKSGTAHINKKYTSDNI